MTIRKPIQPRIIIHGGAGNITPDNLPPSRSAAYRRALLSILQTSYTHLTSGSGASALDVAVHAVSLLENNPLFNAGRGAVFTRTGTIELEASVMVSKGYRKRGVGVMGITSCKNPVKVAREMLVRGEEEKGGGAYGHCQLSGEYLEGLAREWGCEVVDQRYFWTRRRWEEHKRGLEREGEGVGTEDEWGREYEGAMTDWDALVNEEWEDPGWDGNEYLPQGTVGAVVLDKTGTLCVATSTGGLTNKLPGRIGDTPTLGAGFWAEEWADPMRPARGVAVSGTGNGDSFLRLDAVRTACAVARGWIVPLQYALKLVAGPGGDLQQSAGDRWKKTGEGEGGMIAIELVEQEGYIAFDFNCGGMFRAWVDDQGQRRCMIFRDED
ncbi:MAG: hypothetical protein M1820_008136 [Bogoriella megaspora]|nr:MAG: hypothetical protein M1820_008136 [Bogoriella megaspora]